MINLRYCSSKFELYIILHYYSFQSYVRYNWTVIRADILIHKIANNVAAQMYKIKSYILLAILFRDSPVPTARNWNRAVSLTFYDHENIRIVH